MTIKIFLAPLLLAAAPAALNWEQTGRPLPIADHMRVELDGALAEYKPCHSKLVGIKNGSVTTILPDLFNRWSSGFKEQQLGAEIRADPPYGPPQGRLSSKLAEFLEGKSDFALVSRDLTEADLATFRTAHGREPIVIPVAVGSWRHFGYVDTLVVIVNNKNPITRISFAQIDAIFSSTRSRGLPAINDWSLLGEPSWAGRPIHLVGGATWLKEDSARSAEIRNKVLKGGEWRAELAAGDNEASALDRVAADPNAIAITGLGHLGPGVRTLSISADEGMDYIAPTFENIVLNTYPLSRTVDLVLVPGRSGKPNPITAEFARFILSRAGQKLVVEQGVFLPLRADQVAGSLALLGQCEAS